MKLYSLLCLFFLSATAACGGASTADKCKDLCAKTCPGDAMPTAADITNCHNECDDLQARAEKRACDDEQVAVFECAAQHACDTNFASECSASATAISECNAVYCRSHTSDPDC